jgi:phosphopantothenoylcysteine decarboxylase / phosphopantothenate---cysteine ligase
MLKGKKIIIGITGSIAAYKIPLLVRLLKKAGAVVQVILTPDAHHFVTPLTLSVLSENPVLTIPFNPEDGSWNSHVELGIGADLMIIAPASANTMAKMVAGMADNLLLATWLATRCPVFFAPAMDLDMYRHPATQRNIQALIDLGNMQIAPREGELASGLCGAGRMEEPEAIMQLVKHWFKKKSALTGLRFLLTAGPTREAVDPVRYLSNHSSGKMGYAIATALAERGGEVYLVSGPTDLRMNHPLVQVMPITTADEMFDTCKSLAPAANVVVMSAAVADFKPVHRSSKKIKKGPDQQRTLTLIQNPDILAWLGAHKPLNQMVVGFALETDNPLENAQQKLQNKKADLIVLNTLADPGAGFGTDTNKVTFVQQDADPVVLPLMSKAKVAEKLVDLIEEWLVEHHVMSDNFIDA